MSASQIDIPINPDLPEDFDCTPNDSRPESHMRWWDKPYIVTEHGFGPVFLGHWPGGVRYDVRCLDGGAWDRSTWKGSFPTLDEAVEFARQLTTSSLFSAPPR